MKPVLENFSVEDCFGEESGLPVKGSKFDLWMTQGDSNVSNRFAEMAWFAMREPVSNFLNGAQGDKDHSYAEAELHRCLELVHELAHKSYVDDPYNPFFFEAYIEDYEIPGNMDGTLPFSGLFLMGAFTIICVDKTISNLRLNNAQESARYALYIGAALFSMEGFKEPEHSKVARMGGIVRALRSPKSKEKDFVLECWRAWQAKPSQYRGKADFARDMLQKCQHLVSQKKIEDWCRGWERESKNNSTSSVSI